MKRVTHKRKYHIGIGTLARLIGMSRSHVGRIMRGKRVPSLEMFLRICDLSGWTVEEGITKLKIREQIAKGEGEDGTGTPE